MDCPRCGAANEPGRKFCAECGAPLATACPACGTPNTPGAKFCGECGSPLSTAAAPAPPPEPVAERRLVSVLFADLVGFTTLSERRDAEEVRELLSRYFELCRRVIERYGGTVEKFIGDAVMAVWGTPQAQEDDAERAVRTALDLVAAVAALGGELAAPELRLRAGVLTGEAAVTLGAEGEGMVAGDLVNTASRVQAQAAPGTVLVGDATRRASEAAIAYEDAGEHELKGKAEAVRLHRALRVIAARGGEGRSQGLEAPFVGREAEFRLVKELLHAAADERRARLVSIVGVAGIGKSRLAWEFEKYLDGLAEAMLWHRGRCLAYGEGVAYWALAEMIRMRARIAEDDEPGPALVKLRQAIALHVPDVDERAWLEPRLAHLVGLSERQAPDQQDLFSAWRLFFERMAEQEPVILLFEDLQWADAALLDFVEYLLDWSRNHPIFVLTLARPELLERRPSWGAGKRNFHGVFLEPLSPEAIDELLCGLAPGLSDSLRARIGERSEGIPLYAVETVRMLLDRGLLEQRGEAYFPTGPIEALDVPETLHALIGARLDGLRPEERLLLEHAAVLGKTFTREGLAAVSGLAPAELEPLLDSLVRKEILSQSADPRAPDRGQFGFLQALVQKVAYDRLARRDRKRLHLAAAEHLERAWRGGEHEIVAILAAHYLDAYRAGPSDPDARELRERAAARLTQAAERAAGLAAAEEAERYFGQAAELVEEPRARAGLLERSGIAALQALHHDAADVAFSEAVELLRASGETHAAARVEARQAETLRARGRQDEALVRLRAAYETLAADGPDADVALVAAQLARLAFFAGEPELALEAVELALETAEALNLPEALAEALTTKGVLLWRRPHESMALIREAVAVALEHDLPSALRAHFNLAGSFIEHDRLDEARAVLEDALALARRRGDRFNEAMMLGHLADVLSSLGDWDAAVAQIAEAPEESRRDPVFASMQLLALARAGAARGTLDDARTALDEHRALRESTDRQDRGGYLLAEAIVRRAEGRLHEALAAAGQSAAEARTLAQFHYGYEALVEAIEAALALDDLEQAEALLAEVEALPPIERRPLLDAQGPRLRAKLAARRGEEGVDRRFATATARLRELGLAFWAGVALVEHGEWLEAAGEAEAARPLLAEAAETFARLEATPWLERARALLARERAEVAPA